MGEIIEGFHASEKFFFKVGRPVPYFPSPVQNVPKYREVEPEFRVIVISLHACWRGVETELYMFNVGSCWIINEIAPSAFPTEPVKW